MKTENANELESDELYIEELGEVLGGVLKLPPTLTTLALGEEGTHVPHFPLPRLPKPPPGVTTLALGEEGPGPIGHVIPMSDE
jgi:hypothetical protein